MGDRRETRNDTRAEIARLNGEGLADREIAVRLGIGKGYVKKLRWAMGLASPNKPGHALVAGNSERGDRTRAELARMHAAGATPDAMATALNLTPRYVVARLREAGLAPRAPDRGAKRRDDGLTRAERGARTRAEVGQLKRQGLGGKQIAERLGLSVDYVREVAAKVGCEEPVAPVREAPEPGETDGEMPQWWREAKTACAEHLDDLRGVFGDAGPYPRHDLPEGFAFARPQPAGGSQPVFLAGRVVRRRRRRARLVSADAGAERDW